MDMENFELNSEAIAKRVRELMERHGIAERKQTGALRGILNLSFSAAHRKLNGDSPWTLVQLNQVAAHYEESANVLLGSMLEDRQQKTNGHTHDAILVMGAKEIPCVIWIGKPLMEGQPAEFVAIEQDNKWRIVEIDAAPVDHIMYDVEKIEIYPKQISNRAIAVIDDEVGVADNLAEFLSELGYKATAFYSTNAAAEAIRKNVFDGYVVDWLVGRETTENLIKLIRASENPNAPIILLTGEIQTGKVNETEVARLMRRFDVLCQEKPVRLKIIAAELSKALGV